MKAIIKLRKQLGFSQEDMARCLGVKRSMLYRAEECTGDLPTAAYHKMADLHKYIEQSDGMEEISVSEEAELLKQYERQKEDCLYKILALQRKLKKLNVAYATHQKALKVLEIMERNGDVYPLWIEVAKINAKKKLAKCSPLIRADIERKIVSFEAEAIYLKKQSQKLKEKRESEKESESESLIAFEGAVMPKIKSQKTNTENSNPKPPSHERPDKPFQHSMMPEHFVMSNFNLNEKNCSTLFKPLGSKPSVNRKFHSQPARKEFISVSQSNPPPLPVSG